MAVNQFTDGILALRREVAALKDAKMKSASVLGMVEKKVQIPILMHYEYGTVWSEIWEIRMTTPDAEMPPLLALYFDEFEQRYWIGRRFYYVDDDDPGNNRLAFRVELQYSLNREDWSGEGTRTINVPMTIVSTKNVEYEVRKIGG